MLIIFNFLYNYNIFAILVFSALKSEASLLSLIIFLSQKQNFNILFIFLYVFLGSFCFNILIFLLGRRIKVQILKNIFSYSVLNKILVMFNHYQSFFVIFFRFLTGMKIISPFLLSGYMDFRTFILFSFLGDLIWSGFLICLAKILIFYNVELSTFMIILFFVLNSLISSIVYFLMYRKLK